MFKFVALLSIIVSAVNAGLLYDAPAITSQQQNTYRTFGNLGQVSTYSKSIDTPFSSVRKADIRVSNPGLTVATPAAYAHAAYATPLAHATYAAPLAHAAYASPYVSHLGAPAYAPVAKAVAAPASLLGVAYSAAPVVSHMTYSNGLGISYGW